LWNAQMRARTAVDDEKSCDKILHKTIQTNYNILIQMSLAPFYIRSNWPSAFDDALSQDIDSLWKVTLPDGKRRATAGWQPRVDVKV
jgi:hypothetical protein